MTVTVPPLDRNGPLTSGTVTYTYDSQDRLTRELSRRNLTQTTSIPDTLANFDNTFASDAADNLTLLRGVAQSSNADNQIVSDANNGGAYAYDAEGNPTLQEGVNLQYDDEGHLTAYDDDANGRHLRMGYRPDGLRAWRQYGNGPLTYFFYDGDRLRLEVTPDLTPGVSSGSVLIRTHGWGAAGLEHVAYYNSSGEYRAYFAFDPQGNVVSHVKDTGEVLDLACYDAFGQGIGDWAYNINHPAWYDGDAQVGWGGQWGAYTDVVSAFGPGQMGLILLTHRYYNPDTGRFLTRDPIGYEGGVNVYAYCRNNPVMNSDPSGLDGFDDTTNFFAGWGDALSFGLTAVIRKKLGVDDVVDRNSGMYAGGTVVGTVHQALLFRGGGGTKIAVGAGREVQAMKLVRDIKKGEETLADIEYEMKYLQYTTKVEHALVRVAKGKYQIVKGGPTGIHFPEGSIQRLIAHTHPPIRGAAGPSAGDYRTLKVLGQKSSWILERGDRIKFWAK